FREERVALLHRQRAGAHRSAERDLDVNLDVRGIYASRMIDRVGVEPDPALRRLDAAALRHAEIGALSDHFAVELGTGDADCVICPIAGRLVAFIRRTDVCAYTTEEQH